MVTIECQVNAEIEEGADLRKYQIGRLLTFRNYNQEEVSVVPSRTFRRGDVLRVLPRNGCGMGIDVERVSDGKTDMVWPEEVQVRRSTQAVISLSQEGASTMIRPEPISKAQLLEDERFLLELGSATLHGNLPMKTVEHIFWMANRLLSAVKHEQGQRITPVIDSPAFTEDHILRLEVKRLELEAKLGAKISWMENISSASVPIGWGDCVGLLWQEDECLRRDETAPHLSWAIAQFIGVQEEFDQKLDQIDNGDSGLDLYAGGWVRLWSYNGDGLGRVYQVIQPSDDDGDEVSLEGMSSVEEWGWHTRKRGGGTL